MTAPFRVPPSGPQKQGTDPFADLGDQTLTPTHEGSDPFADLKPPSVEDRIRANPHLTEEQKQIHINRLHRARKDRVQAQIEQADAENPGIGARTFDALTGFAHEAVRHPLQTGYGIVKGAFDPIETLIDYPVQHAIERQDPNAKQAFQQAGIHEATGKDAREAAAQAAANLVAPKIGLIPGATLAGIAYNPEDPSVGGITGGLLGVGLKAAGSAAVAIPKGLGPDIGEALPGAFRDLAQESKGPTVPEPTPLVDRIRQAAAAQGRILNQTQLAQRAAQVQAAIEKGVGRRRPGGVKPEDLTYDAEGNLIPKPAPQQGPSVEPPAEAWQSELYRIAPDQIEQRLATKPLSDAEQQVIRRERDQLLRLKDRAQKVRLAFPDEDRLALANANQLLGETPPQLESDPFIDLADERVAAKREAMRNAPKPHAEQPPTTAAPAAPTPADPFADLTTEAPPHPATPAFPEGFTTGSREPRIPDVVPERRPRIQGENAPGMYLTPDVADRLTTDQPPAPREPAPVAPTPEPTPEPAAPRSAKEYKGMSRDDLFNRLQEEYDRMDAETNRTGESWTRYDENMQLMRSGSTMGAGMAKQQAKFTAKRIGQIETELQRRYGLTPDDIASERLSRLERNALANEQANSADAGDFLDFLYGKNTPPEPPPSVSTGLPELPTGTPKQTPADRLLNPRTFDQSPAIQGQLTDATQRLAEQGVTKFRVPQAEGLARVRAMTHDALVEMGMDPTTMDLKKVGRLSGEEIVAFKQAATERMDQIAAIAKQLEQPNVPVAEKEALSNLMERAIGERDQILERVVTASSQKGRDLAFLRQIANRSLDPDVWVVQARRLAGDRPLSDSVIAEIRKLAREAAEACSA